MVLQNYQKFIVLTSNMIYIVELGVGFKYPRKIHLNIQWRGDDCPTRPTRPEGPALIGPVMRVRVNVVCLSVKPTD